MLVHWSAVFWLGLTTAADTENNIQVQIQQTVRCMTHFQLQIQQLQQTFRCMTSVKHLLPLRLRAALSTMDAFPRPGQANRVNCVNAQWTSACISLNWLYANPSITFSQWISSDHSTKIHAPQSHQVVGSPWPWRCCFNQPHATPTARHSLGMHRKKNIIHQDNSIPWIGEGLDR